MSLGAKYQAFLASPSSGALADKATLHYITTLTSINDAAAIVRHLAVQEKLLKKKAEKVLSVVEGAHGVALDVETTLEFVSGGGAYLPGLDDNFVADRTVTFPMVHIVHFDEDQKIVQVRLYWDQGSLLKQIDVIGARARNWPIRDGKDQSRLVATNAAAVAQPEPAAPSRRSTASRGRDDVSVTERPLSSRNPTNNATNDPHATLSLFQPRDVNQESSYSDRSNAAPRAQSAKPPPRNYSELFAGSEGSEAPAPGSAIPSPQKRGIPAKSGAGKSYKPNRMFDEDTEEERATATPMGVKTNAKKYDHFAFGEEDEQATPKVRETARPTSTNKAKHSSQWDFEDFVTPDKPKLKILAQAVRHFGWSDDEEETSPVSRPVVHKARPDADPHFQFVDDGTPESQRKKDVPGKSRLQNKGLGLYKDHVLPSTSDDEDEDTPTGDNKRPLGDVTTAIKNESRKKDFGSQWEMTDDSSNQQNTYATFNSSNSHGKHAPESRKQALKSMDAHWGMYEQSPEQSKKENVDTRSVGIKISGNGMGGRSGVGRSWAIGDEDDEAAYGGPKSSETQPSGPKGFWDF